MVEYYSRVDLIQKRTKPAFDQLSSSANKDGTKWQTMKGALGLTLTKLALMNSINTEKY